MALHDPTVGLVPCPHCGAEAPYNFRVEDRLSARLFKAKEEPKRFSVAETRRVIVCVKCGEVLNVVG